MPSPNKAGSYVSLSQTEQWKHTSTFLILCRYVYFGPSVCVHVRGKDYAWICIQLLNGLCKCLKVVSENLKPFNTDTITQPPLLGSIRLVTMVELFQPAYLVRRGSDWKLNVYQKLLKRQQLECYRERLL